MRLKKTLEQNESIVSVEALNFDSVLEEITDPALQGTLLARLSSVEVYKFTYKVEDKNIVGYISMPRTGSDLACLIHLRGGSRDFGMLQSRTILRELVRFSSEGYIVITTQYPGVEGGDGNDTFGGPDDIASIIKLKDILAAIPEANSHKIGVKGHSRGGLMTYMLLREVNWIKCAVIAGAPVDQIAQQKERGEWRAHQISMWGRSKNESIRRSPICWANELSKIVPLLIMHGSSDWRVLPSHGLRMSLALTKLAVPHRFILFEGADHGLTESRNEYFRQTLDWFNRFLRDREPLPNMTPHGK